MKGDLSLNFYVEKWSSLPSNTKLPCVLLVTDNWNDYGFETTFEAIYYDAYRHETNIGIIKILHIDTNTTRGVIPHCFTRLDECYCSLGIDISYYKNLCNLGHATSKQILAGLNDTATNRIIRERFTNHKGFKESLLRNSESEKALNEAGEYFGQQKRNNVFNFTFSTLLSNASTQHIINFDFLKDKFLPYRINVLIGKNGTGKTQVLSKLANALSGYGHKEQGFFTPTRPLFSKVIAISYSAFDKFEKPHQEPTDDSLVAQLNGEKTSFSFVYCGIQGPNGVYKPDEIVENFTQSFIKVQELGRTEKWRKVLEQIIEPEHAYILEHIQQGRFDIDMSSGQSVIMSTITEVIAHITNESILLFDEPELHLHPNAMSNLIRMFYVLLEEFNSYAIVSTHSPIIIQETPSKFVTVLERFNDTPFVRKLGLECFGENIGSITNETFGVKNIESNYKGWLEKMARDMSYDEVLEKFQNNLSFNAMTYLNILYKNNGIGARKDE